MAKLARDLSLASRRNLILGLFQFLMEEFQEPEHAEGAEGEKGAADIQPALGTEPSAAIPAAGAMIVDPMRRVLFVKRSAGSDHAGTWCFPGGGQEEGETPAQCAARETKEETGHDVADDEFVPIGRRRFGNVDYVTHLSRCDRPFVPVLNDEHSHFTWAPLGDWPEPLHPAVSDFLDELDGRVDAQEAREDDGYAEDTDPDFDPGVKILLDMRKNALPLRISLIGFYGFDEGIKIYNDIDKLANAVSDT
jgi:8-oxo-dGTP pyrophosphatase MutT (NUDIX family)